MQSFRKKIKFNLHRFNLSKLPSTNHLFKEWNNRNIQYLIVFNCILTWWVFIMLIYYLLIKNKIIGKNNYNYFWKKGNILIKIIFFKCKYLFI